MIRPCEHLAGTFSATPSRRSFFASRKGRRIARLLESASGLAELNRMHDDYKRQQGVTSSTFCRDALSRLRITPEVASGSLSQIPQSGPLLIVANHPTGAAEGLVLESLVRQRRGDVKVLANRLLARLPESRESSFFVDPFGGPGARHANIAPLRAAIQWLRAGHALIVFPAGEVAHFRPGSLRVEEPPWTHHVARLARRTSAAVVSVCFEGRNSLFFQFAGLIHPRLRTALLPRELLRRRGKPMRVHVGTPVFAERLARFGDDAEAAGYLRLRTLILGLRNQQRREQLHARDADVCAARAAPIVAPLPPEALQRELAELPAECLLLDAGEYQVFVVRAEQAPTALHEIGRLREKTFRLAGEGTGREIDLDRFDFYYEHLFVHDQARRRIVGAYRLGCTEEIVPRFGVAGLYTHTLFHYDQGLLDELGPAFELGRSFVTVEYQRSYPALLLLWKGIARMVLRRPQCRRLFGVVSISEQYQSITRQLLMSFLRVSSLDVRRSALVAARTPPRAKPPRWVESELPSRVAPSMDLLDEMVQEIENQQRGVPVLLRQYLGLGAKVLGFNIDPAFGNVLDALMVVDLARVPRPLLDRFFGRDQARMFQTPNLLPRGSV